MLGSDVDAECAAADAVVIVTDHSDAGYDRVVDHIELEY
jgi:hypothetical protein